MPYITEWQSAEVFLEHNGVSVYHVYRHNHLDSGKRSYIFSMHDDGDDDAEEDEFTFDVRTRCDLREDTPEGIKDALRRAIDDGTIKAPPEDWEPPSP